MAVMKDFQKVGQRGRSQIGHAQSLERIGSVGRVDRYDVGVLKVGEGLGFMEQVRGYFRSDEGAGQFFLLGQVDTPEGAAGQLGHQTKALKIAADLWVLVLEPGQPV